MFSRTAGLGAVGLLAMNAAQADELNIASQLAEGGVALLVILALSILALTVTIERLKNFRKATIVPDGLLDSIVPLWQHHDFIQIQDILSQDKSTLGRIIRYALNHRHKPFALVSSGVSDIASLELRQQQQKAYALAIVATVAPIVGLLGTVIGMIEAFHVIAYSDGMGNPALLAGGISKALVNTASGLSVALPALGMHHFFKHRANNFALQLESQVNQFLHECIMSDVSTTPNLQVVTHAH